MKIQLDPDIDYQNQAIDAVADVFLDLPNRRISGDRIDQLVDIYDASAIGTGRLVFGNQIYLEDECLLGNVREIQQKNGIDLVDKLRGREFSVVMETGTGKIYVLLRTIIELHQRYGLLKFVVVAPNLAHECRLLHSIEVAREHLLLRRGLRLYEPPGDSMPFDHYAYDSNKLNPIRKFSSGINMQIMIVNMQSWREDTACLNSDSEIGDERCPTSLVNRPTDSFASRRPIEFLRATRPIVISYEPLSDDGGYYGQPEGRTALAQFNPIATLRYSAALRKPGNLLYMLDPVEASGLGLVKRIEVASVNHDCRRIGGMRREREIGSAQVENGESAGRGNGLGSPGDRLMRAQVYETIEQHLRKERLLRGRDIKILSLLLIDKASNYRYRNSDGTAQLGKIGEWFEEAYRAIADREEFSSFSAKALECEIADMHNGYFRQDQDGGWQDSDGSNRADDDAYALIMGDKEKLLSTDEPSRFIFSHRGLREGWDNPNVFQVCALNETASIEKLRQETGRGLRLPVNTRGKRIRDGRVNYLTVIASER